MRPWSDRHGGSWTEHSLERVALGFNILGDPTTGSVHVYRRPGYDDAPPGNSPLSS
jgi:hypothetical protein